MKRLLNSEYKVKYWLSLDDIYFAINELKEHHDSDPIHIIHEEPLEFVAKIRCLSSFYGDSVISICAVLIRTLIQDHPLQDGNKRLGVLVGTLFLENNGFELVCSDEDLFEVAIALASGNMRREELEDWLGNNIEIIDC